MKKFLNKAKSAFDEHLDGAGGRGQQQVPMQEGQSSIQPPTPKDVTRFRYHHGCNMGSVFILEKWLTGSMFPDGAPGSSELAAAEAWVKKEGVDHARQRFEKHWREYVSDGDLDWLRDHGKCTTIRLPIGYFTLGPPYCEKTPFRKVADVYQNAWHAVQQLVQRCHQRGIGVLIDLHGLPGGANAQEHSGTNSNKAELWSSSRDKDLATRCLLFIAQQARNMEGVAGLQIINEAEHGADAKGMYEWYDHVISEVQKIDDGLPIYISDAWVLDKAASWSQGHNSIKGRCNPVVVDTHCYWCFGDDDKRKSPQEITHEASNQLSKLDGKDGSVVDHGAAQAIVGEYSCVLGEESWAKGGGNKDDLVRQFGNAQSQRYQQRAGGSFFWTYRMDWMPGGEWGFKQMTDSRAIIPPVSLTLSSGDVHQRIQGAQSQQQQSKQNAVGAHAHYWDTNHPGQYEHWRFEQGWDVGFHDAMTFLGMRGQAGQNNGGDKIGMLDLWVLKRLRESGQGGKFMWEFEQGLRQGVKDFYSAAGV
ncbi:Glucan 1,3-beta-glucosidase 3 [Elasticomyces elasticus]|nr:Glucan 1,3-beta-glucosidase 3 [Elasticomyces elasticus]